MKKFLKVLIKIGIIATLALGLFKSYSLYNQNVLQKSKNQEGLPLKDRSFVLIIFPHELENEELEEKNILSILTQSHLDFQVLYLYNSEKGSCLTKTKNMIGYLQKLDKVTFLPIKENEPMLLSLYQAIQNCDDEKIILPMSNHDFLSHENVLSKLNNLYKSPFTWMTYGSFLNYPSYKNLQLSSKPFPKNTVFNNSYRSHNIPNLYPITCYAKLFKQIQKKDLLKLPKQLFKADWSLAYTIPLLEMAGKHARFVNETLYLHARIAEDNLSHREENLLYLRKQPKYKRLKEDLFTNKIAPSSSK